MPPTPAGLLNSGKFLMKTRVVVDGIWLRG